MAAAKANKESVARAAKAGKAPRKKPASGASVAQSGPSGAAGAGLRVRMYRVGFGDFFLLSVPTPGASKPFKHILIDCGVHAVDLGSIEEAVAQMAQDCGGELALV